MLPRRPDTLAPRLRAFLTAISLMVLPVRAVIRRAALAVRFGLFCGGKWRLVRIWDGTFETVGQGLQDGIGNR